MSNYLEVLSWLKASLIDIVGEELGTFKTKRGTIHPATWIKGPMIPPDWERRGLVITIDEQPEGSKEACTGGAYRPQWWQLEMIQYDSSRTARKAFDFIDSAFPKVTMTHQPQTMETLEQYNVAIWIPEFDRKVKFVQRF
jgi:hypothetical protein